MITQTPSHSLDQSSLDKNQSICPSADDCYNAKQAAEVIGIAPVTFSNWKKDGQVTPDHKHGKRDYYSKELIDTYRTCYQTANTAPDLIEGHDIVDELSSKSLNSVMIQTSVDYNSEELFPFKAQEKIIRALIISSAKKTKLLHLFLGILISLVIELMIIIQVDIDMYITGNQLQNKYFQTLNFHDPPHNPQGFPLAKDQPGDHPQVDTDQQKLVESNKGSEEDNKNNLSTGSSKISI